VKFEADEYYLVDGHSLNRLVKISSKLHRMSMMMKPKATMLMRMKLYSRAIHLVTTNSQMMGEE